MLKLRRSAERGHADHGWLDTRHTFSFADYHDPAHVRFRTLRVLNEDVIAPGAGFGRHPHQDMEIVTVVLEGALLHEDSTGRRGVIRPGDVQRMSAGTGVFHSEMNASDAEPVHLVQIWILPARKGLPPEYEERAFPREGRRGRFQLVADSEGRGGALRIHQDASLYLGEADAGTVLEHALVPGRHAWVQVLRGTAVVNGTPMEAGDGAAISGETLVRIAAETRTGILLFDLA